MLVADPSPQPSPGETGGAASAFPLPLREDQGEGPALQLALGVHRSATNRRWVWRETDARIGLAIAQRLDVPEIVGRLLAARGIDAEGAADFLTPTLRALLPDPSRLIDMDAAAERLAAAVRANETVAVFGDYDVDGACSAALMTGVLRELGCRVIPYVPDRLTEGYGPNPSALQALLVRGATLVVCVDCGTAAGAPLSVLRGQADVVVLDHHKSDEPPPAIAATVNPNRLDCQSRMTMLCAAGVAFLATVALVRTLRRQGFFAARPEPDLMARLDIVALATVCDVMPLTGVNRALVRQGLAVLAKRARIGLAALMDAAQVRHPPDAFALGFALGPRINAAGRISECDMGLRLLLAEDEHDARTLAARLDAINRQRQDVEAEMLEAAMHAAEAQAAAGHAALLVSGVGWHPGVVGIVAGRIKERFNRPACVAGIADNYAKGSGRSVAGIDLGAAVIAARQHGLLATGGGHAMAAGFSLQAAALPAFHAFLDDRLSNAARLPGAADLVIDGALSVGGATAELAAEIDRLAPFGQGNDEPLFALSRARVVQASRIGASGTTIRAFIEGEGGGTRLKAMLFRARDEGIAELLLRGQGMPLHLAGHLRAEQWNGTVSACFTVRDAAAVTGFPV